VPRCRRVELHLERELASTRGNTNWSQWSWLEKAGEAEFWMTVHRRAHDQATRMQGALDIEAILPSSTNQESPKSEASLNATDAPGPSPVASAEKTNPLRVRQQTILKIAEELVKVKL